MIARALAASIVLSAAASAAACLAACAEIDPPAAFVRPEAGVDPARDDAGPFDRCRVLARRFATDAEARVYGDPSGPQAVCVTLRMPVPAAGDGAIVFCVAGADLGAVSVPAVRDLSPDLQRCATCTDVRTNCTPSDGGGATCPTSYAPIAGRARIVRLGRAPGEPVWIDVGDLVVARVVRRDETSFELERLDCLFADGLTLQGVLTEGDAEGCEGLEETACAIARTAASRFP